MYSIKKVVGTNMISAAKAERETSKVRSVLESGMCTNSEVLKTMVELSDNINRRMDLNESKIERIGIQLETLKPTTVLQQGILGTQ